MTKERRVYQRTPIELAASYGMPEDEELLQKTTIINISGGGFCFTSREMLKVGETIKLSVDINENDSITIPVTVAWNKKIGDTGTYTVGVSIADSSGEDFDRFLDFYIEQVRKISEEL